jgi:tetratricopeptide (TPR) repeat protein
VGQHPKDLTPDAGPWHRWGFELRQLRLARRMSQRQLSARAAIDRSHVGRLERAERPVPHELARALDHALDAGGTLVRRWEEASRSAPRDHGAPCEEDGTVAHGAGPGGHGARGLPIMAGEGGEATDWPVDDADLVIVPARRQGRICFVSVPRRIALACGLTGLAALAAPLPAASADEPAGLDSPWEHFSALRRALIRTDNLIGPRHVLPALQQHLASLVTRRRQARGADAVRLLTLETRYEELAGWLAQDTGDTRAAHGHTARALDASHIVGDAGLTAYVLGRKAQLALDTGHPHDALGLAAAAARTAPAGSRVEVIAALHTAHAHAVLGEGLEARRAYDTVASLLDRVCDESAWGSWLNSSYVDIARARSFAALGAHEQAAGVFERALLTLPAAYRRDRGVYLARAARARAEAGDLTSAARIGRQAVGIAAETGSARIFEQLGVLDRSLSPASGEEGVAAFRGALDRAVLHVP